MKNSIQCFERLELRVDKAVTSVRFYDSNGIDEVVEPFYYQPIEITYDVEGIENVKTNGEPYFCVRYTPRVVGVLIIEQLSNDNIILTDTIEVLPTNKHGYVTVSNRDSRYFDYSDGTPFVQIGVNMAYPTLCGKSDGSEFGLSNTYLFMGLRQYERWFKKASANGVNVIRLWLGHEYFCPDTEIAYELDMIQFSKIDEIIKLAKKYGIILKLTIEQFRFFDYVYDASSSSYTDDIFRKFNKRLYLDGTSCKDMQEWLNDSKWGDAWIYKISEFAKRYSGETSIFAIELWNEMNCVGDFEKRQDVIEWNKKYLPIVKKLFPHNMVINSLGSLDNEVWKKFYDDFCWDKSDFKQIHRYLDQGAKYVRNKMNPIEAIREGFEFIRPVDKPVLLAETGAVNNCHSGHFKYYSSDDDGLLFADCVYTPLFCNSCGIGNIWHWDERYLESKNLYKMYKPVKDLLEEVDMAAEHFESVDASNDEAYIFLLKGKSTILGYIRNKEASWQNILRDLKEVNKVDKLGVDIDKVKNVQLIPIWDDNTTVNIDINKLIFENIEYGIMFKAKI